MKPSLPGRGCAWPLSAFWREAGAQTRGTHGGEARGWSPVLESPRWCLARGEPSTPALVADTLEPRSELENTREAPFMRIGRATNYCSGARADLWMMDAAGKGLDGRQEAPGGSPGAWKQRWDPRLPIALTR